MKVGIKIVVREEDTEILPGSGPVKLDRRQGRSRRSGVNVNWPNGAGKWTTTKLGESEIQAAEMNFLRGIIGKTRSD